MKDSNYYTDTANDRTVFPSLHKVLHTDICVIGGGFSGVATALSLSERNRDVVLLEAQKIGWGATGRNGGQCIAGFSGEQTIKQQLGLDGIRLIKDLRYKGHEIISDRIAKYNIDCDWKPGWLEVAAHSRDMESLRRTYHERRLEDEDSYLELVEKKDLKTVLGTSQYYGGLIDRRSGHLHPLNLCLGEARAAKSRGVSIYEGSEVVELKGGAKPFARTQYGKVYAQTIVLAGDTHHDFERGKLRGLQFPTGSYMIATEPLDEKLALSLNPQDLAICDTHIIPDYYRLSHEKRMLFGGRCNYSNRDPIDITNAIRQRMIKIFPQLRQISIDYTWEGRIGIVLNRVPAIGRLEPNLYYLQGYCGHGINVSHIAGELISDAICGMPDRFDLFNRIRHMRIPFGKWVGNYILALTMLYERLRQHSY
ncbi:MAG: NAD(P)/FAD-dependent oxidoreductase [Hyphomicrobium sp.]